MAKKNSVTEISPAEFKKIPLDFIISTPLITTIQAHKLAAQTTLDYVKALAAEPAVKFTLNDATTGASGSTTAKREIEVPVLSIVKVPNMNFDSLSVEFDYNISQVYEEKSESEKGGNVGITGGGMISKWLGVSLGGNIGSKSNSSLTSNRSGSLSIKIHASESEMPQGLAKIIDALTNSIDAPSKPSA